MKTVDRCRGCRVYATVVIEEIFRDVHAGDDRLDASDERFDIADRKGREVVVCDHFVGLSLVIQPTDRWRSIVASL